jgi:hypothetical protein
MHTRTLSVLCVLLAPLGCESQGNDAKTTSLQSQEDVDELVARGGRLIGELNVSGTVTSLAPLAELDASRVFTIVIESTESLEVIEGLRGFTVFNFFVTENQALRAIEETPRGRDVGKGTEIGVSIIDNPLLERVIAQDFEAEDVGIGLRGSPLLCTVELPSFESGTCSSSTSDCCAADPLPADLPGCDAPTEQPE